MKKLAESSVDNGAQRDARHLARAATPDVMSDEGIVKNSLKGQKGDGLGDDKVYSNQEVRTGICLLAQLGRTTLDPNPDPNPTAGPVVNPNPDIT